MHENGSLVLPYRAAIVHALLAPDEQMQIRTGMVTSARMIPLSTGRIIAWYDVIWPERNSTPLPMYVDQTDGLGLYAYDELVPLEHGVYTNWYESVTRQKRWPISSLAHLTCMMRQLW